MTAETLGQAHLDGWRVRVRCAHGRKQGARECVHEAELDMGSLVWTRGRNFPVHMLSDRLQCPRCGSRRVTAMFFPPSGGARQAARADPAGSVRDPIGRIEQQDRAGRTESVLATTSSWAVAQAAFRAAIEAHSISADGRIVLLKDGVVAAEHPSREAAVRAGPAAAK